MLIRICKLSASGLYKIAVNQKNLLCGIAFDQASISATATMSTPIVKTRYGALKGTVVQSVEGGQYLAFNGIPYAEPPVGQLRFKEPQPPKAWSGIRDARKEGSAAIQVDMMRPTSEITGSEDCLYLNVSTNSLSGKRAVMVWIHGGAFVMGTGSSETYGPDYLLKHDIVFVSIYYRLHVLGFLNVDDAEAAGNQGLKDQVAALKWVQENIEAFGGDPQNVTIFGESAGSASVHYLTLSPLAKGLFHKAIGQSGSVLNSWAYSRDNKESGLQLAALLGFETTDAKEAVQFLRTVDAKTLNEGVTQLCTNLGKSSYNLKFIPTMDDKSENPFAPQPAAEMAKKGIEVPSIFGYNSHEGIMFLVGATDETYSKVDNNFDVFFDSLIVNQNITKTDDVVKSVRKYYFGEEPITSEQRDNFVQLVGDFYLVFGIRGILETQSRRRVPLFFYRFSGPGKNVFMPPTARNGVKGTCHGDEVGCILYHRASNSKLEPDSKSRVTMEYFTRLWTNFAKTGDPTPKLDNVITKKWLPVTKQEVNYLEINEDLITGVNPDQDKWQLWKSISESA